MGICFRLRQTTGEEAAVNGQSTFQVQYVHITCFFNFKKKRKKYDFCFYKYENMVVNLCQVLELDCIHAGIALPRLFLF